MHRVWLSLALVVLLAACGSDRPAEPASAQSPGSPVDGQTGPTASSQLNAPDPSDEAEGTAADHGSTVPGDAVEPSGSTSVVVSPSELDEGCRPLADLEEPLELARWQIINDGVMGGRSSAETTVADSVLIFAGEIVTDGGGFSSIRLALDEPLGDVSRLLLRVRTDGRSYELTAADARPGRDRRISHQGVIPATGEGQWEEVVVGLDDLEASIFGRPVTVDPFDPESAVEIGIILADGRDGQFRLELDWIRACA